MSDGKSRSIWLQEQTLMHKLFIERFDGVILIDRYTEKISVVSNLLADKLLPLINDEDSFDKQVAKVIEKYVSKADAPYLTYNMVLSTVIEKLKKQPIYEVDFNVLGNNNIYQFHRISFEYCSAEKTMIAMLCENISKLVTGEIDPLTGGYNTSGFHNRINEWIAANPDRKFRLHRYNLDRFRDINGVYGHDLGDKLLRDIADYMKQNDSKDSFFGRGIARLDDRVLGLSVIRPNTPFSSFP